MGSSQLSQVLIVLLFLCVLPCLTKSAIPSHQQPLPVTGQMETYLQDHQAVDMVVVALQPPSPTTAKSVDMWWWTLFIYGSL
ncbi:hypothetical protein HA466_0207190 [Hirschfeldia incana]|nr:hypothetical protein HA466_0207190 [Hirschfeldia incana]